MGGRESRRWLAYVLIFGRQLNLSTKKIMGWEIKTTEICPDLILRRA